MRDTAVETGDGRLLQVLEAGDPNGFPVFVHHGTPASRLLYEGTMKDAEEHGIRLISHDRPGYGGSSRQPGRKIADVVQDVKAMADELGIDRFATWGISGGAPHALACGALLPERCVAVASLASIAPYDAEGLDFAAGMGEQNVYEFKLAAEGGEAAIRPPTEEMAKEMLAGSAVDLIDSLRTVLSPVDEAVFRGDAADYLVAWMTAGIGQSIDGWVDDDLAFVWPWGFDVHDITVPVQVWQGRHDRFVPFGHADWFVEQVPTVDARLSESDGHLTLLLNRIPEIHAWLLEHA